MSLERTTAHDEAERKVRRNISLENDILEKGEQLKALENRNFSNLVSWLIKQEHARRFPKQAHEQQQEAAA